MKYLKGLKNLEVLYLWGTKVGDDGLQDLGTLDHLKVLDLSGLDTSDKGIGRLGGLKELRTSMCPTAR